MAEFNFWNWFDDTAASSKRTRLGQRMVRRGYDVAHTGGGCLVWEKIEGKECNDKEPQSGRWAWICDIGQGLHGVDGEPWLVGIYAGDFFGQSECRTLDDALAWCERALANPQAYLTTPH